MIFPTTVAVVFFVSRKSGAGNPLFSHWEEDLPTPPCGSYNAYMDIRPAQEEDYSDIAQLRAQTIRSVNAKDYPEDIIEHWSAKVGVEDFRNTANACKRWVAVKTGKIIGFCEHTFDGEISRMYVHKNHLREGIGSQLLEVAENSLRQQGCKEVQIESTITAKSFYENNGYELIKAQDKLSGDFLRRDRRTVYSFS
jgi:putative acetyltransferase